MCSKYPSTQKLWKKAISYKKKSGQAATTRTEAKKHRKPFAALKSRIWKKIHSIAPIYTAIICITYKIFSNTTGHFSSIPLNSKRYCNMELFKKDSIWRLEYVHVFSDHTLVVRQQPSFLFLINTGQQWTTTVVMSYK